MWMSTSDKPAASRGTLFAVHYMRGGTAVLVVLFHIQDQMRRAGVSLHLFDYGAARVDMFFVISGFVLWYTTAANMDPREFYRRRIVRILPLYWLVTTFMITVIVAEPSVVNSAGFNLIHVLKSYLFIAEIHPTLDAVAPVLVPGWTLNLEMFFYLIFGFLLALPVDRRIAALVLIFVALASLHLLAPDKPSILGFYTNPIILEFAAGALIGYAGQRGVSLSWKAALPIAATAALVIVLRFDAHRILKNDIPAIFIVGAIALADLRQPLKRYKIPAGLGDASYSVYLSHGIVLSALLTLWGRTIGVSTESTMVAYGLAAVSFAIAGGVILYRTAELPLLRIVRGRRLHQTSPSGCQGLALSRVARL